jgi:hypothetical protein
VTEREIGTRLTIHESKDSPKSSLNLNNMDKQKNILKQSHRIHRGQVSNYNEINEMINELMGKVIAKIDEVAIIKGDRLDRWETTDFIPNTF